MRRTLGYTLAGALVGYLWWLVTSCTPCEPQLDAATPVDAAAGDACICEPHWPTCPSGCTPPDGGDDGASM